MQTTISSTVENEFSKRLVWRWPYSHLAKVLYWNWVNNWSEPLTSKNKLTLAICNKHQRKSSKAILKKTRKNIIKLRSKQNIWNLQVVAKTRKLFVVLVIKDRSGSALNKTFSSSSERAIPSLQRLDHPIFWSNHIYPFKVPVLIRTFSPAQTRLPFKPFVVWPVNQVLSLVGKVAST